MWTAQKKDLSACPVTCAVVSTIWIVCVNIHTYVHLFYSTGPSNFSLLLFLHNRCHWHTFLIFAMQILTIADTGSKTSTSGVTPITYIAQTYCFCFKNTVYMHAFLIPLSPGSDTSMSMVKWQPKHTACIKLHSLFYERLFTVASKFCGLILILQEVLLCCWWISINDVGEGGGIKTPWASE